MPKQRSQRRSNEQFSLMILFAVLSFIKADLRFLWAQALVASVREVSAEKKLGSCLTEPSNDFCFTLVSREVRMILKGFLVDCDSCKHGSDAPQLYAPFVELSDCQKVSHRQTHVNQVDSVRRNFFFFWQTQFIYFNGEWLEPNLPHKTLHKHDSGYGFQYIHVLLLLKRNSFRLALSVKTFHWTIKTQFYKGNSWYIDIT